MPDPLRKTIEELLAVVETAQVDRVMSYFAADAVMIDPHYPTARMVGKPAIAAGLRWAFGVMKKMSFKIANYYEGADGHGAAVEVATTHELRNGAKLNFSQTFVIETRDGLVTRLQAYEPYGPHGVSGLMLRLAHVAHRVSRRR